MHLRHYYLRRKRIPIVVNAEEIQLIIGSSFGVSKGVKLIKRKLLTPKVEKVRTFERASNKKRIKGKLFNLW
ncbi:MAG: hypothetical protein ACTS5F_01350 [Candidatus Hodgkinia cicadicola]